MKEFVIDSAHHRNLRDNGVRSTLLIGKHDLRAGDAIVIRSKGAHEGVVVRVIASNTRDIPLLSKSEAKELTGNDVLYAMHRIFRRYSLEELDRGVTYVSHTLAEPLANERRASRANGYRSSLEA